MNRFAFVKAQTLAEAAQASATVAGLIASSAGATGGGSVVKAGGIDLLDLMKENLLAPDTILSLRDIPDIDTISARGAGLRIGAMATLAGLADHPLVRDRFKALAQAAAASDTPQIRNVATVGGNLLQRPRCWYFRAKEFDCLRKGGEHCFAHSGESQYHAIFDNDICAIVHPSTIATVLVALEATVELVNAAGVTRRVRLADFFVSPSEDPTRENDIRIGEILVAVEIPATPRSSRCVWLKQGQRASSDWPLADVAVALELDAAGKCTHAVIVLGAVAPVPRRATSAEALLVGSIIDDALTKAAGCAALDGVTPLTGNRYKLPLLEALVQRAIAQALTTPGQSRQAAAQAL